MLLSLLLLLLLAVVATVVGCCLQLLAGIGQIRDLANVLKM